MKQQIETLSRLALLRANRVKQMLARVAYQQNLCQRYRANIAALDRLCGYEVGVNTTLQRDNQQRYKLTLHKMLGGQRQELALAEQSLERIREDLLAAMRQEQVINVLVDDKLAQWQQALARQEQKIQDGLAAQAWWRTQAG